MNNSACRYKNFFPRLLINSESPQKSSNVKHVTKETKQNKSTLMTREEYKRLPQTGSDNSLALVALGALSSMFGLGLASFNRKKVL